MSNATSMMFSLLAEEEQKCNLMSTLGQIIQLVGGLIAFCTLVVKWRTEARPRHPYVWFFDTTKNVSSQIVGHTVAVIVAYFVNKQAGADDLSPCSWYFVIFITDVTVGVFLSYQLHKLFIQKIPSMGQPGDYDQVVDLQTNELLEPPKLEKFLRQMSIWLFLCVIPARIFCGILVSSSTALLSIFARILAQIFKGHPDIELVFVLIAGPVVINSIQFIVQDMFLAQSEYSRVATKSDAEDMDLEYGNYNKDDDPFDSTKDEIPSESTTLVSSNSHKSDLSLTSSSIAHSQPNTRALNLLSEPHGKKFHPKEIGSIQETNNNIHKSKINDIDIEIELETISISPPKVSG